MRTSLHAAAVAAAAGLLASAASARDLTPQERAGKRIYAEGRGAGGGEIRAFVGSTPIPASAVTCSSCHGEDGLGRPEGGVQPPSIVWSELTKPYGHVHPQGRKHSRFDARAVIRAVSEGVDPAGNALDEAMPRFSLSRQDAEDLVAYLRALEHDRDPGITPASLRVATVLPTRGPLAEVGSTMRKLLEAAFEEANAGGGIHGRRIELAVAGYDPAREGAADALRRLVAQGAPFALVSGLAPGGEEAMRAFAEHERIPLVAPFGTAPPSASAGRYAFYVLAGVRAQARVLARYAATEAGQRPRTAVLHAADPALADAARAAAEELRAAGFDAVEVVRLERVEAGVVRRLESEGVERVIFLGGDEDLAAFTAQAAALGWAPRVTAPGTLAARAAAQAPPSFDGRIFLSYPALPGGRPDAVAALARLRQRAGVEDRNRAAQVAAVTAASLLSEGLRRAGRGVSRERLVDALEGLFRFDPGLVPPLSFGPSRRVGALGGYVVGVDLGRRSFAPVSGWIGLE